MRRITSLLIIIASGFMLALIIGRVHAPQRVASLADVVHPGVVAIPTRTVSAEPILFDQNVSAYAVDTASMQVLYAENELTQRPIASLTKMMTVYVVLSHHSLDEVVTIGTLPTYDPEAETLGLKAGEKFKLAELVTAALLPSDNDAADALAIYDAGSLPAFIQKMNETASSWGIDGVHFASASGLTDDNNYATAAALSHIAQLVLTSPTMKQLIKTPTTTITAEDGTFFNVTNTDDLLAGGDFYGIKTGYTAAAGQCFVGLTTINGHEVITVVLGSADRFGDTTVLRNWIKGAWTWQ